MMTTNFSLAPVRNVLAKHLPWSPMDFIRNISVEGDRALYAAQLTPELPELDDLRFVYDLTANQQVFVSAERLPWDSSFFGYNVARLNGIFHLEAPYSRFESDFTGAIEALLDNARYHDIAYLFALIDSRDLATVRALCRTGFELIETRCFYHRSLTDYAYERRFPCRLATADDVESLTYTAQTMINSFDRFHSDIWIDPGDADRMMRKWVEASVLDGFADATIVPAMPNPKAFCTVKYHKSKWDTWNLNLAQPVFSAVSENLRGWYLKIISELHYHLIDLGAEHSFLSTQITNKSVIRVWEKLGYSFGRSEYVFRVLL